MSPILYYLAKIFLKQENKILELDARPSDAIALAVRYDKEVYVKKSLFDEEGVETC